MALSNVASTRTSSRPRPSGGRPATSAPGGAAGRVAIVALLAYAAFVVYQTLAGGGTWACGGPVLALDARLSRTDLLANLVAYVPIGLLGVLAAGPRRRVLSAMLVIAGAAALSLGLEVTQSCQSARVSSPYDWAANTCGATLGALAGLLATTRAAGRLLSAGVGADAAQARLRLLTIALAIGWVVSQTMPWVFSVDLGTLRSNLSFLKRWQGLATFDAWHVARHGAAWLAVAAAWRLALPTPARAALAAVATAAASVTLQLFLDARAPLSFDELLGLVLGGVTALALWPAGSGTGRSRVWGGLLALAAAGTVAAYELRPVPGADVQAFRWWPQVGLGGLRGALDYALLFGWSGAAVTVAAEWRARGGDRLARRAWPVAAILVMLALEAMQTGIPGRGPDVSAPLFTALAVVTTLALLRR
jgi:VanZ family protein